MKTADLGRTTHQHDGELVVFLIGTTVNQWWRLDRWVPVLIAMPAMLAELSKDPTSGLLSYRLALSPRGPTVIQYWSTIDALYAYASDAESKHRPAWRRFNQRSRTSQQAVGIWHETFAVERAETLYVNTPLAGLAAGTRRVPVGTASDRARDRLR